MFTEHLHEQAGVHETSEWRNLQLPVKLVCLGGALDEWLHLMVITEEQQWNTAVPGVNWPQVGFLRHGGFVDENGVGADCFADDLLTSREQCANDNIRIREHLLHHVFAPGKIGRLLLTVEILHRKIRALPEPWLPPFVISGKFNGLIAEAQPLQSDARS